MAVGDSVIVRDFLYVEDINGKMIPSGDPSNYVSVPSNYILTADEPSTSTTRADVIGFTIPLLSGQRYLIELYGAIQTVATTTGASFGWRLSAGTCSVFGFLEASISVASEETELKAGVYAVSTSNTLAGSFMTSTGVSIINQPHQISSIINIVTSANCNLFLTFGTEVAGSTATLLTGSLIKVTKLT